jgi:hypothetical protein
MKSLDRQWPWPGFISCGHRKHERGAGETAYALCARHRADSCRRFHGDSGPGCDCGCGRLPLYRSDLCDLCLIKTQYAFPPFGRRSIRKARKTNTPNTGHAEHSFQRPRWMVLCLICDQEKCKAPPREDPNPRCGFMPRACNGAALQSWGGPHEVAGTREEERRNEADEETRHHPRFHMPC